MKKVLIIALALILILTLAAGCGNGNDADSGAKKGIDALPADSGDNDALADLDIDEGSLKSFFDDEGFSGRSDGEEIYAPVNEDWEVVAD